MDRFIRCLHALTHLLVWLLPINIAYATTFEFPTALTPGAVVPSVAASPLILDSATPDTYRQYSSVFQYAGALENTINFSSSTAANTIQITIDAGAILSYFGSNALGKTINGALDTANAVGLTVNNAGNIAAGNGLFGIYMSNAQTNAGVLTVNNTGSISSIFTNNLNTVDINLNGSARIIGGINMAGGTNRRVTIGNTSACNFTTEGTWDGLTLLTVNGGSTFNQEHRFTEITAITNAGTYNVNASLGGLSAGDGAITNSGTMNIASNINKIGAFTTNGTTRVTQPVTVATSSYQNTGTHIARLYDLNNVGHMTLTNANPVDFNTFSVEYTGGYLNSRQYTLLTTTNAINTNPATINIPANTMFLSFGNAIIGTNTISIPVTRTPYSDFTNSGLTTNIAIALEQIGTAPTVTNEQLALLNAVEQCTNRSCVDSSMRQLAPLTTAPIYAFHLENVTMRQVELRLAALHNDYYYAGDSSDYDQFIMGSLLRENYFWLRPYGAYANQESKDDSLGYYATTGGIALGFDRNLDPRYNLGLGMSYSFSNVKDKVNSSMSGTDVKSYQGMVYGTYNFTEHRYLDWIASITANEFDGNRFMSINSFVATADSSFSSQNFSVKGILGTNFAAFDFLQVNPEGSLLYTYSKQYTYQETNAGAANLLVNQADVNLARIGIGVRLSVPLAAMPSVVVPEVQAQYLYNILDGKQKSVFNFVDGPTQVISRFTPARSLIRYGASLTVAVYDSLQVKAAIDAETADRYSSYWVYLNLKYLL